VGDYDELFKGFWAAYPRGKNDNKKTAHRAWLARLKAGTQPGEMTAGAGRYATYVKATGRYAKNAATFLGPDEHWKLPWVVTEADTAKESGPQQQPADPAFKGEFRPDMRERPGKAGELASEIMSGVEDPATEGKGASDEGKA